MMRAFLVSIVALAAMMFAGGLSSEADAGAWLATSVVSGDLVDSSSGLVVKIKKKKHHHDNDEDSKPAKSQSDCKPGTCFGCGGAFAGCSCHKVYCEDVTPPKKSTGNAAPANNDDDTGLSECTIQGPNSGGGCKGGFKYVCEKLKSGKKCCGCVVDKNAEPAKQEPPKTKVCCGFQITNKTGSPIGGGNTCSPTEAAARAAAQQTAAKQSGVVGSITCEPK
jgi:hypothetical protein